MEFHTTITKGLSKKFGFANGTYSLSAFELGVWKHLRDTGMDLVFYFLNGNNGTMQNIVNRHSIFLLADIRKIVCEKKVIGAPYKYDTYDLRNLTCSQTFLLSSLTDDLLHAVEQKITNKTSRPEIWMYIVDETQLDSACCHQRIRDLICGLRLTDFPGENVRLFNQKCLSKFHELDNADALDDDLLLRLLEAYTKSATETFRVTFITQRRDLETYLRTVKGKSIAARCSITGIKTFMYVSIMEDGLSLYNALYKSGDWSSGITIKRDKHRTATVFSHHKANLLIASPNRITKPPITCYNCGMIGHMSREYSKHRKPSTPNSHTTNNRFSGRSSGGRFGANVGCNGQGQNNGSNIRSSWPMWHAKPPDSGTSEIRTYNGSTFYWCSICKHWRTTHSTNGIPADNVPCHTNITKSSGPSTAYSGNYATLELDDTMFDW